MDPTARYFGKLRCLAVTVETETANLQQAYQNYVEDNDDNIVDGARVLHELHLEIKGIKGQVQDQLVQQRASEQEVRSFMEACLVMRRRFTADLDRVKQYCEQYGYQAPASTGNPLEVRVRESEAPGEGGEGEEEAGAAGGGEDLPRVTPLKMPPPSSPDPMRTPQPSDFGLSEGFLKDMMGAAAELPSDPPTPTPSFCPPSLRPHVPKTPKCALLMSEDEEPTTPHLSEYSMCLNNDFTMDLCRKEDRKTRSQTASGLPDGPPHGLTTLPYQLATNDSMQSPEPPVLFNPGFNLIKTHAHPPSPPPASDSLGGPGHLGSLQSTPEAPAYINTHLGTKKDGERDAADAQDDAPVPGPPSPSSRDSRRPWERDVPEISVENLRTPPMPNLGVFYGSDLLPRDAADAQDDAPVPGPPSPSSPDSRRPWERDVPEISIENLRTPPTPNLLYYGSNLPRGAGGATGAGEPSVPALELDGATEEFNLMTPRVRGGYREVRGDYREVGTPDLGSVTLEVTRLVSQTRKNPPAERHHVRSPGKENRAQCLSAISKSEFLTLPSFLRQMSCSSLNEAVQKINSTAARQHHGQSADYLMEDLKRIAGLGTKAPIYFLCLKELKRLEHVEGIGANSVYRLLCN